MDYLIFSQNVFHLHNTQFDHIYHLATKKAETYSDEISDLILNVDYDSKNEIFEYKIEYEKESKSFIFFFSAKLSMETRIFFSENFEETVDCLDEE